MLLTKQIAAIVFVLFFWIGAVYVSINQAWGAPVQLTGFETSSTTDDINASGGTFSISSSSPITGLYSFISNPATTAVGWIQLYCVAADGTKTQCNIADSFLRIKTNFTTLPGANSEEIVYVADSGTLRKAALRITSGGNLALYNSSNSLVATGATVISTGVTYRVGLRVGTSAGSAPYLVSIDGTTELSGTGAFLSSNMASYYLGKSLNINGQGINVKMDDIMIDDASMPGQGSVLGMVPDANGSTFQWTVGTGSANYAETDEMPTDGDTTYIQKSAASSQTALVGLATAAASGITGRVNAVKAYQSCKEVSSVTSATSVSILSGGSSSTSTALNGTTSYATQQRVISVDPSTSTEITLTNLNGMEMGAIDTASTDQVRCSTFRLFVDVNNDLPPLGGGGGAKLLTGVGQ